MKSSLNIFCSAVSQGGLEIWQPNFLSLLIEPFSILVFENTKTVLSFSRGIQYTM